MKAINNESIFNDMKEKFVAGTSNEEILDYAIVNGIPQEDARTELTKIQMEFMQHWETEKKAQVNTSMVWGILLLTFGIILTFSNMGYIFYGAIAAGIGLIVRGSSDD